MYIHIYAYIYVYICSRKLACDDERVQVFFLIERYIYMIRASIMIREAIPECNAVS